MMGLKSTTGVIDKIYNDRDESGKTVVMASITYARYRGTDRLGFAYSFPLDELPSGCKVGDRVSLFFHPESKSVWLASGIWIYPIFGFGFGSLLIVVGLFAPRRPPLSPSDPKNCLHEPAT